MGDIVGASDDLNQPLNDQERDLFAGHYASVLSARKQSRQLADPRPSVVY
jgi:hypothetical protein